MFTFTDVIFTYVDDIADVQQYPSLIWLASSADNDKVGTYDLKFKLQDSSTSSVLEQQFTFIVIDNPCLSSWTNIP